MENSTNSSSSALEPTSEPRGYTRSELIALFHTHNPNFTLEEVFLRVMAFGAYKEAEPGSDSYVMVSLEEFLNHYGISRSEDPAASPGENEGTQKAIEGKIRFWPSTCSFM